MPLWLRRFTLQTMNEYYENQNKEVQKVNKQPTKSVPKGPSIGPPTYSVKKSK